MIRSPTSSIDRAASSDGSRAGCFGRYVSVAGSSVRISEPVASSRACRSPGRPSRRPSRARSSDVDERRQRERSQVLRRRAPGCRCRRCPSSGTSRSSAGRCAGPVIASISSIVYCARSRARAAPASRRRAPMWLAMKFGVSFATTTPLPRRWSAELRHALDDGADRCRRSGSPRAAAGSAAG